MSIMMKVEALSKKYKVKKKVSLMKSEITEIPAVREVAFKVEEGDLIGLVGPNGAGKTTLLSLLCGLMLPDEGNISFMGADIEKDRKNYVRRIGVLIAGKTRLPWGLSVRDGVHLNGCFYGIEKEKIEKRMQYLADLLEVSHLLDRNPKDLSLGEKMKMELLQTFIHEPDMVFLDEPTIGVDVTVKETIRNFILQMNKIHNLTVIMTSHDKNDIEKVCDRIINMEQGRCQEICIK